jgi:hypothetical protein
MQRTQEQEAVNPAFGQKDLPRLQNGRGTAISNEPALVVRVLTVSREPETSADAVAPPARH